MSEVPPRNALNLWKNGPVAVALEGADGQARMLGANNPLPVAFAPGAASDPDSAREVTLQQVLTALLALGGNTDGLEAVAAQQKAVLDQLAAYSDGVESLLGSINGNTDGIESLLSSLGLKDDNVLAKLTEILAKNEQIRAALVGTLAISAAALPLPAGAATSALQTAANTILTAIQTAIQGTLQVKANPDPATYATSAIGVGSSTDLVGRDTSLKSITVITIGAGWTAQDISFEHSSDGGATWTALKTDLGNPLSYKATANSAIRVPANDLMRCGLIRARAGVPGAYINQTVAVPLTYTLVTL